MKRFVNQSNKVVDLGGRRFMPGAIITYPHNKFLPKLIQDLVDCGVLVEVSNKIKAQGAAVAAPVSAPEAPKEEAPADDKPAGKKGK